MILHWYMTIIWRINFLFRGGRPVYWAGYYCNGSSHFTLIIMFYQFKREPCFLWNIYFYRSVTYKSSRKVIKIAPFRQFLCVINGVASKSPLLVRALFVLYIIVANQKLNMPASYKKYIEILLTRICTTAEYAVFHNVFHLHVLHKSLSVDRAERGIFRTSYTKI